jgi:hypothetical protein
VSLSLRSNCSTPRDYEDHRRVVVDAARYTVGCPWILGVFGETLGSINVVICRIFCT